MGWTTKVESSEKWFPRLEMNWTKNLRYCFAATLIGAFFLLMLKGVDPDLLAQTQWSGPQTIYIFLAQVGYLSIPVAAISWLRTRKMGFAVMGLIAGGLFLFPKILGGKRDEIIQAGMIFAVCWMGILQRSIPRALIVAGGILVAIVFTNIGIYRSVHKQGGGVMEAVEAALNPVDTGKVAADQKYQEVTNFLTYVEQALQGRLPSFGLLYWNSVVRRYFPGQILGQDFKESLMMDSIRINRDDVADRGLSSTTGVTPTGYSDTLLSFSIFGIFVYYLVGRGLRKVFVAGVMGSDVAWCIYPTLLVASGVAITHSTFEIMAAVINIFVFQYFWIRPKLAGERVGDGRRPWRPKQTGTQNLPSA